MANQQPILKTMSAAEKERFQADLDALGRKKPADSPADSAAFLAWRNEVWIYLNEHYTAFPGEKDIVDLRVEARTEAINEFCESIDSFDPEQSSLSHYALSSIAKNQRNIYETENAKSMGGAMSMIPKKEKTKTSPGEKAKESQTTPLVLRIDNSTEDTPFTVSEVAVRDDPNGHLLEEAYHHLMVAMILNFWELFCGQKGAKDWLKHFPMWYSEKTKLLQQIGCNWDDTANIMRALDYSYLSFFLDQSFSTKSQQTWDRFQEAELKGEINVPSSKKPIDVKWNSEGWLPLAVPSHYLCSSGIKKKPVPVSTISGQRKKYLQKLDELLYSNNLTENRNIESSDGEIME